MLYYIRKNFGIKDCTFSHIHHILLEKLPKSLLIMQINVMFQLQRLFFLTPPFNSSFYGWLAIIDNEWLPTVYSTHFIFFPHSQRSSETKCSFWLQIIQTILQWRKKNTKGTQYTKNYSLMCNGTHWIKWDIFLSKHTVHKVAFYIHAVYKVAFLYFKNCPLNIFPQKVTF